MSERAEWYANVRHSCECDHKNRPVDQLCVDCPRLEICPGCDTELTPTSGGKKQCRGCGFLLTCCD